MQFRLQVLKSFCVVVTVVSPVVRLKACVLACAYPRAHLKTPVPPPTAFSLTWRAHLVATTELPLYLRAPAVLP
jgi:hypothetical protein